ncbi:MAG: hypothetical protein AB7V27_05890 [Candidatus Binatia bacterium]
MVAEVAPDQLHRRGGKLREPVPRAEVSLAPIARLIGCAVCLLSAVGVVAPQRMLGVARAFQTPAGLFAATALRVVFGALLIRSAPASRAPRGLRALGWTALLGGLATPFIGTERTRAMLDWWSGRGETFMRLWSASGVALGGFAVWALRSARRAG